jgi:hypothetical protein
MATAKKTTGTRTSRATGASTTGDTDLQRDIREFAKGRPQGWNHEEWLAFLEHLKERGHNINDREAIGSLLERERINLLLEKIPGLGPQRIRTLSEKFGSVWSLRDADATRIATEAKLPRDVAQRVVEALQR